MKAAGRVLAANRRSLTPAVPQYPLPLVPRRVTGEGDAMQPQRPCSQGGCEKCRRGLPHAPLLAVRGDGEGAWAEATKAICVARWIVPKYGPRAFAPGELCGSPAERRIAGIDLCWYHFTGLERWRFDDTRAEEVRRESVKILAATHERRKAASGYAAALEEYEARRQAALAERSVVYYLRRVADGMIKIGFSANFRGRLTDHRHDHGPVQILLICGGGHPEELDAHSKFRPYRIGIPEWFRPARPLLGWIYRARQSWVYAGLQPEDVLPIDELRRLMRAAPQMKYLRWDDDGVLQWPPEIAAA